MSLILDALRKLDREKSSHRGGPGNIAVEILRPDRPRPGRRIVLYFAAIAIATTAIAYVVFVEFRFLSKSPPLAPMNPPASSQPVASAGESGSLPKSSPPLPVKPPASSQKVASTPSPGPLPKPSPPPAVKPSAPSQEVASTPTPAPLPKPSPPPAVKPPAPSQEVASVPSPEMPVRSAQNQASRVPPRTRGQAESHTPAAIPGEKRAPENMIPRRADLAPPNTEKLTEPPATGPAATPPPLKISGILWNEEPTKRRAVINGNFATEGSTIEGVKVLEIFPTRVRFSHNGRAFEISVFE